MSHRRVGQIILRTTYGYHAESIDDAFLKIGLMGIDNFGKATTPGAFLVDLIPVRTCSLYFDARLVCPLVSKSNICLAGCPGQTSCDTRTKCTLRCKKWLGDLINGVKKTRWAFYNSLRFLFRCLFPEYAGLTSHSRRIQAKCMSQT